MKLGTLALTLTAVGLIAAQQAAGQGGIVSEVEAEFPLYSTNPRFTLRQGRDIDSHLALTYGGMKKISDASAMGITGSLMTTGAKSGSRAEVRFGSKTRTLTEFHGTLGVERWGVHGPSNTTENAHGLTASAAVSRSGIAAEARVDLLRTRDRGVGAFSLGARAGGKPGRVIMIAAASLALLFLFSQYTGVGYSEAT